ncbi:Atp-dependent dna helicase [Thalictrum thalictroides]|uniref:Atp-dependent dna helicase n=2 Tax=Thalictrum thalictroides TaxID=46969 RepID=A0A7J6WGA8_THATH|nr:Atp-dependent dna helicase [Thalictrum thalictroides]
MVEYCEGSCCRRKQILEFFGEKVPTSLCRKSCDACKHPNLVAKYLEELKCEHGVHGRSRIFMSSFSDKAAEDHFTEFWNRDEASVSEEDISDSDDCVEIVRDMAMSKPSLKSGLEERLKFLEQAEENYYQKKIPNKQKSLDQKAVPEALREASKQRLLNALKQSQQRLGNIKIGLEPAVTSLENECYLKYGKIGKTFYNSQVASTVRWLSNSSCSEITERLGTGSNQGDDDCEAHSLTKDPSLSSSIPIDLDQGPMEEYKEEIHSSVGSKAHQSSLGTKIISQQIELPPIPSFSEFVRKGDKEVGSNSSSTSTKRSTSLHSDTDEGTLLDLLDLGTLLGTMASQATGVAETASDGGKEQGAKIWASLFASGEMEKSWPLEWIDHEMEGDVVVVPRTILDKGIDLWKNHLVGYFIDKMMPYFLVKRVVEKEWKLKRGMQITTDGKLYYFKFVDHEDRRKILEGGPIFLAGQIMVIRLRAEDVYEERNQISTFQIWVKCYDIPTQVWCKEGLSLIGSRIGKPECCDEMTMEMERLDFCEDLY